MRPRAQGCSSIRSSRAPVRRAASSTSARVPAPTCAISRRASAAHRIGSRSIPIRCCSASWRAAPAGVQVRKLLLDLAQDLEALPLDGRDLVTAAALLDLVSASWLARLATRCAAVRADVLFALTYDGRIEWSPAIDGDARMCELVNLHQRTDKGFGPALGPAATTEAGRIFA